MSHLRGCRKQKYSQTPEYVPRNIKTPITLDSCYAATMIEPGKQEHTIIEKRLYNTVFLKLKY